MNKHVIVPRMFYNGVGLKGRLKSGVFLCTCKRLPPTSSVYEKAVCTHEPSSYACSLMVPLSFGKAFKFSSVKEEILLNDLYLD